MSLVDNGFVWFKMIKSDTQPAGFEPARGDPIGFQVQRLNHSAKTADRRELKFHLNWN